MPKMATLRNFFLFMILFLYIFCGNEIIEIKLEDLKRGSLRDNEYDFYKLILPAEVDKSGQLIVELEPNVDLDAINNIISDPNLYISVNDQYVTEQNNMWASNRYGDETIAISGRYINPFQPFYIGVHCIKKCNYILKVNMVKNIIIQENKINSFTLEQTTVMKFSFTTREVFSSLSVNVVGSFLNSFNTYLSKDEAATSTNSLEAETILFNGYQFNIKGNNNGNKTFNLVVDNSNDKQELNIWLKYDDDIIRVKEAEIVYDAIPKDTASCYYYAVDKSNQNKDIILSTTLFNGEGFIYISGFINVEPTRIDSSFKKKDNSYSIIQNKAIHLTKDNFKNYGRYNDYEETPLNFCFYAEKDSSFSIKMHLLENFKNIQNLNYIYPGIKIEDVLPKKSLTKYKMEHFNIENDLNIFLTKKSGNSKLYLYMAAPDRNNDILEYNSFQPYKKADLILEGQETFNGYNLFLTKEANKCKLNKYTKKYSCYLTAIVECDDNTEDCTYELYFDHSKMEVDMEPKRTYSNVISENEIDKYTININDPSIKNIAIVLTQKTGKSVLVFDSFITEIGAYQGNGETIYDKSTPGVIKISNSMFSTNNLVGTINIQVQGLSFAGYSLYYYSYNEEENENSLDQEKVSRTLELGSIIKDIFIDNHKFKVYMYDSSKNGKKNDLFISLVETDSTNSELYIFKDLNDFSFSDDKVYGYIWRGEYRDYVYISSDDNSYKENDILYILIYKKGKTNVNDVTTFYLGITDKDTPFLLNEGIEFKQRFESKYLSQKFFYNYVNDENDEDLQISFSLYYGHIRAQVKIDTTVYTDEIIEEESQLIFIRKFKLETICQNKYNCPIYIEVSNDDNYLKYSSFLIAVKSSKDVPIYLKQGVVNRRTILSGEEQHFIIDLKPDKTFGAKISVYFERGQGEIYARKLLRSELYNITNFPNENNYEYMASYKNRRRDFYILEIPYEEIADYSPCKILVTVRGMFPGYFSGTKIDYSISVSNSLTELETEKNYKLFISQGEIIHYHFRVGPDKKRLYISMSNKEQDANMFLNYETYLSSISEYHWKNIGSYNEFLDLSVDDPYFAEKQLPDIDGEYYLAIQGLHDCFFNLYISTQDVKIMTLAKGIPAACSCEIKNDFCYFRYESMNKISTQNLEKQEIIFYPEYTYGSGKLFGKLYENGNMEEIINNLPSSSNNDYLSDNENYLYVNLNKKNSKYTRTSVLVVGLQCKEKSLFDLSAANLDSDADLSRTNRNFIFLKLNQDNIFYLSRSSGKTYIFVYYMYNEEEFNFQIKGLVGQAEVHTYTNESLVYNKFIEQENKEMSYKNYHHISNFILDSDKEEKKVYYGLVSKEYAKRNYFFVNINPINDCLININIHYDIDMVFLPLNKEIMGIINKYLYYAYFDILKDNDEVIFTLTSLEKGKNFNIYLKKNIIKLGESEDILDQVKYSMPSSTNYDVKGETNPLTSAISLRIKNVPKNERKDSIVRVLINIESDKYCFNDKIKMTVTPVLNNMNRIKPQPHLYYFSDFEKKYVDKTLYLLRNVNKEDDLMVIEISLCKGNFIYVLTDTPPAETDSYIQLQKKKTKTKMFSSNGKKIITVENLEVKEYYLTVFGANTPLKDLDGKKRFEEKNSEGEGSLVDILFVYYTTNKKNYNYLVTQDYLNYESKDDYYSLKIKLPELKRRDLLGRENYVDYMNYTFIVSEKEEDFYYMESTCYLTKLMQKEAKNKAYNYLQTRYDKEKNTFQVKGFLGNKKYYINILGKNEYTGEIVTYNPVMIVTSLTIWRIKVFVIVFLTIICVVFVFLTFTIYRKYRIEKAQLNIMEGNKSDEGIGKKIRELKNINLNVVKKKYNSLNEEKNSE